MSSSPSQAKLHIAMLLHSMNDGGAQKRVVSLVSGFGARGYAVDLVTVEGAGEVGRQAVTEVRQFVLRGAGVRRTARLFAGLGILGPIFSARSRRS